jgi:adenylate kinase family enzyme
MALKRIVIVGKSGTGKTTLATQLADRLNLTNVELDGINWQANWVSLPKHELRECVDEALPVAGHWIADGSYVRSVRDIVWIRADTLIWLDYSLRVALLRLLRRTIGRIVRRKELWNGNRENLRHHLSFDVNQNLFLWTIRTHKQHRNDFPALFEQPEYRHLNVLWFRTPKETEQWLRGLPNAKELGKKTVEQEIQPIKLAAPQSV